MNEHQADHQDARDTAAAIDDLLTLREVADLLRVPEATLRYWRHCGTGPNSFKIGRHVRYLRSEVLAWLHGQRATGGSNVA